MIYWFIATFAHTQFIHSNYTPMVIQKNQNEEHWEIDSARAGQGKGDRFNRRQ